MKHGTVGHFLIYTCASIVLLGFGIALNTNAIIVPAVMFIVLFAICMFARAVEGIE